MGLGGTTLPPLPPGKAPPSRSTTIVDDAPDAEKLNPAEAWKWDKNADLPESEDEDALSGAPTAPHSQPGTAPASRQQKKRGKSESTIRNFHASLTAALAVDEERKTRVLTDIYKTSGLQNSEGTREVSENLYRSTRVVHTSSIIKPPPFPKEGGEGKAIRDAKNKYLKGSMPSRCVCPHSAEGCIFMDNSKHMQKFLHWCPQEDMCDKRSDKDHLLFWLHPSDFAMKADEVITGWKKENEISPFCVPDRAAAMYQNHQPRVAYCPRGGFRPQQGNKCVSTEFRDLSLRKDQIPNDFVTLLLNGIEPNWGDAELLTWCQKYSSPNSLIHLAKVTTRRGSAGGTGFVSFQNYDDAQYFANATQGIGLSNSRLHVEYARSEHVDPGIILGDNSHVQETKKHFAATITVARMNRLIKSCGPYASDAVSILNRMNMEGLRPSQQSIKLVLQCLHDASPPQAERAENLLTKVCYDEYGGIRLTPHMCNIVIDAWCKLENMRRAELLAQKMDEEETIWVKPDQFEGTDSETAFAFPAPNHETYEILTDGWTRIGMADEVGERHSVFKLGAAATAKSLAGTRGAVRAAASVIGTWGRRRSGYLGENGFGLFRVERGDRVKKGKGVGPAVYRAFPWRPIY